MLDIIIWSASTESNNVVIEQYFVRTFAFNVLMALYSNKLHYQSGLLEFSLLMHVDVKYTLRLMHCCVIFVLCLMERVFSDY